MLKLIWMWGYAWMFLLPTILILFFFPVLLAMDIYDMRTTQMIVATPIDSFILVVLLMWVPSFWFPPLRRIYVVLPWLFPFMQIMFLNAVTATLAWVLIREGYLVMDESRHTLFFLYMIIQVIVCRLAISVYFHFRPAIWSREEGE